MTGGARKWMARTALAALLCTTALTAPAFAATFTVTNLADSGAGSLRQAIIDANNLAGADTITVQVGVSGSVALLSNLSITEAVTIDTGLTISGNFGIDIATAGVVTLSKGGSYTGNTTLTSGTLRAEALLNGSALASNSSLLVMSAGTVLDLDVSSFASFKNISGDGAILNNSNSLGGGLNLIGNVPTNENFAGTITGTGSLTMWGGGEILTLSGSTDYSGDTNLFANAIIGSASGPFTNELRAGATNAFSANSAFVIIGDGTLNLNNFNQAIGSLEGAGGAAVLLGTGTLTTGSNNTSTT